MALGRVYKRNEIWWVAFSYQGKEYRRSANTTSKRQAEQVLAFFLGQMARGEFKGFQQESALMFYELLDDFLADLIQRGRRYVNMATVRSRHLKAFFPDGPVEEMTERRIDLYIKHRMALGRKRSTIDNEMQHLGQAFRLAHRKKLLKEIPYIPRFREQNARQGFFEREEFERIHHFLPDYLKDVMRFAYVTGWRKMEILTLEWRDIHDDVIRMRPEIAKNKEGRVLILVGELADILNRRHQARFELSPYVFHRDGKPIRNYDRAWRTARIKAGLPNKLFHDARRTAARNMDRAGVPREVAKQITGHKTDSMYNRYRIVNEQDIREGLLRTQIYLEAQQAKIVPFGHGSDTVTG